MMYNPAGDNDFEFIELLNTGSASLDLTAVSFTGGIEFSFARGEVRTLLPGEYAVVVQNRRAFESRYHTDSMHVAGEYAGRLANEGERISLVFGAGLPILDFWYSDSWYPVTNGGGYSLEIVDPRRPAADWSSLTSWQASALLHGTPGLPPSGVPPSGGLQLPADANQDSAVDISDAIALLLHLFHGSAGPLPCAGETVNDGGNRILLDASGDGRVDISDAIHLLLYIFRDGPPPAGGRGCIRIDGCAEVCGR
jgi:hypothetical protein